MVLYGGSSWAHCCLPWPCWKRLTFSRCFFCKSHIVMELKAMRGEMQQLCIDRSYFRKAQDTEYCKYWNLKLVFKVFYPNLQFGGFSWGILYLGKEVIFPNNFQKNLRLCLHHKNKNLKQNFFNHIFFFPPNFGKCQWWFVWYGKLLKDGEI